MGKRTGKGTDRGAPKRGARGQARGATTSATEQAQIPRKRRPRGRSIQPGERLSPATEFKKGDPRINRGGRPKVLAEIREQIQRCGEGLVDTMLDIVYTEPEYIPGDNGGTVVGPSHRDRIEATKVLMGYGYGRPTQAVELTGKDGKPLEVDGVTAVVQGIEDMTTGGLRRRLDELRRRRAEMMGQAPKEDSATTAPAAEPSTDVPAGDSTKP